MAENEDAEKRDEEQEVSDTDVDERDEERSEKTDEEQAVRDTDSDTRDIDDRLDRIEDMISRMSGSIRKIADVQSVLVESGAIIDTADEDPSDDDGMDAPNVDDVLDLRIED